MNTDGPSGAIYLPFYDVDEQTGRWVAVELLPQEDPLSYPMLLEEVSLWFEVRIPSSSPGDAEGSGWYPIRSWDGDLMGVFIPDKLLEGAPSSFIAEEIRLKYFSAMSTLVIKPVSVEAQK